MDGRKVDEGKYWHMKSPRDLYNSNDKVHELFVWTPDSSRSDALKTKSTFLSWTWNE